MKHLTKKIYKNRKRKHNTNKKTKKNNRTKRTKHVYRDKKMKGGVFWNEKLPKEEQTALDDLKTKAVVVADLYRDLRAAGVPFKLTAFRSHMRGYCACPKM